MTMLVLRLDNLWAIRWNGNSQNLQKTQATGQMKTENASGTRKLAGLAPAARTHKNPQNANIGP